MLALIFPFRTLFARLLCTALFFCAYQFSRGEQKITVDDADVARIDSGRVNILANAKLVSLSSSPAPYLDCDGYRDLLKLDNKIIPMLIREMVQFENSSILYGKKHYLPSPKDNKEWLQRARLERQETSARAMPRFICLIALANTSFGKASHRTGFDGIEEIYQWLHWWEANKDRYALTFKDSERFDVGDLDEGKNWPHLSCKMTNGLLNVRAVHATFKNIVENAAAEAGVDVVVGDNGEKSSYIGGLTNIITAINYKEMTFDEFAFAITEQIQFGFPWRKGGDIYYFGTGDPAPGRWMMGLRFEDLICEIKMDKTVFKIGERMPVGISLRYPDRKGTGIEIIAGAPPEEFPVFVVQVMDEDGNPMSRSWAAGTAASRLSTRKLGGATNVKQFLGEIDLSRIFKFAKPGDYAVTVIYKVGQDLNAGEPVWRGETASEAVYVKIVR